MGSRQEIPTPADVGGTLHSRAGPELESEWGNVDTRRVLAAGNIATDRARSMPEKMLVIFVPRFSRLPCYEFDTLLCLACHSAELTGH
jgi:hypothetical protein